MKLIDIENEKNIWDFDVEVYPNFFCATVVHAYTEEIRQFVIHSSRDDRKQWKEFVESEDLVLVSYNGLGYDNLIINKLSKINPKFSPDIVCKMLYQLSQKIVSGDNYNNKEIRDLKWQKVSYRSIDMMQIKPSSMNRISLKQIAINLKWYRIQDLPKHWSETVSESEIDGILEYNVNDCMITKRLFFRLKKEILLRQDISKLFDVNVINETESGIANKILNALYSKESGLEVRDFKDLKTYRNSVCIGDCVSERVSFETPSMQNFLRELKATTVYQGNRFKFEVKLNLAGVGYKIGAGGLHSEDDPGIFVSDSEWTIRDADGTSFYPNLMRNEEIYPEHLNKAIFLKILGWLIDERVAAKKINKVKANALKITINSIFGKLNFEFFWLLDPKAMLQVTINGQLLLLKLAEMFHLAGIQVISANTDGVVCRVHKSQEAVYQSVCEQWEKIFAINLEYTDYLKYVRRDVNNYFTIKGSWDKDISTITADDIKEKGIFEREINLFKGYSAKIIPKAIFQYFTYGIPVDETIRQCTDVYEFMFSQKVGSDFKTYHRKLDEVISLQKNNRFFVSTDGGSLFKKKPTEDKITSIKAGKLTTIANDVDESKSIESYNIDYSYYVDEALAIVEQIEPVHCQMSIFDLVA